MAAPCSGAWGKICYALITNSDRAASGGVRSELRGKVLRPPRSYGPVLSSSRDVDQLRPQVPPGGTRAATQTLSTSSDVRGDS